MTFHRSAASVLVLAVLGLSSCKVSDDAIAASQQMTATAECLRDYYAALERSVTDTIALFELDSAISGIPYGDNDRKLQETTLAELRQREAMAEELAELAASMTALSNPKMAGSTADSATKLGKELASVKALPSGSPVPDALGKAGNFLIQIAQQHEEKKAAKAMDDTLSAVAALFAQEKNAYDTMADTHDRQASQVAMDIMDKNGVDPTPMLSPALKPFGLTATPPSAALQASLKQLAKDRLKGQTAQATRREEAASAAMVDSLNEMSKRVHALATDNKMPVRGEPTSLKQVKEWVESLGAAFI